MSATLNQLVRDQILAEVSQMDDPAWRERYVNMVLDKMSNTELLERISAALYQITEGLSVSLGL